MKEILINETTVMAPETPGELDSWRYEVLLGLKYYRDYGHGSPAPKMPERIERMSDRERMQACVAVVLCGHMPRHINLLTGKALDDVMERAYPIAAGFIDAKGEISLGCADNKIPHWWGRNGRYNGPGPMLDGMRYGDVVKALQILTTGSLTMEGLIEVARIAYGLKGDDLLPATYGVATLAAHCAEMILHTWRMISEAPVWINGEDIDLRILFRSDDSSAKDDGLGWNGITFEVARSGVFGTTREVENADFWEVLLYLYKCRWEYNESRQRHKTDKL